MLQVYILAGWKVLTHIWVSSFHYKAIISIASQCDKMPVHMATHVYVAVC